MEGIFTLCIVQAGEHVLLAKKKRKIGKGLWNGYGGKLEKEDASLEEAAKRELTQESGLLASRLELRGILDINNAGSSVQIHIFRAEVWGEAHESAEMEAPQWFHRDKIPYEEMMEADKIWFPRYLSGRTFRGNFTYDENNRLVDGTIWDVPPNVLLENR